LRALEALTELVSLLLRYAYEGLHSSDDESIPGVKTIPRKGVISSGLKVRDMRVYRLYENLLKDIAKLVKEYTRRLWDLDKLDRRVCEKCYNEFMGYEGQRECYRCRCKGE
jgi:hypothetical protein